MTPELLLEFMPVTDDGVTSPEGATQALVVAEAAVEGYTRGRHKTVGDQYKPGIQQVILLAAARILANPGQVETRYTAGAVSVSKGAGFSGFTLAEQAILNRYRHRAR